MRGMLFNTGWPQLFTTGVKYYNTCTHKETTDASQTLHSHKTEQHTKDKPEMLLLMAESPRTMSDVD